MQCIQYMYYYNLGFVGCFNESDHFCFPNDLSLFAMNILRKWVWVSLAAMFRFEDGFGFDFVALL